MDPKGIGQKLMVRKAKNLPAQGMPKPVKQAPALPMQKLPKSIPAEGKGQLMDKYKKLVPPKDMPKGIPKGMPLPKQPKLMPIPNQDKRKKMLELLKNVKPGTRRLV